MKCSICKEKAVIELNYLKKAFCKEHFIDSFEERVKKHVEKNKLVDKNDKIVVGVSGGKDSLTMLYLLNKWYPGQVSALTVDEGIKNYREHTIKIVEKFVKEWGINYKKLSFKEGIGFSLDEICKKLEGIPCSYCGVFRRYLLNKGAREMKATKIAIGHNLDDEAQSIMMNLFQHGLQRFVRMGPLSGVVDNEKFIRRIKPLREITEKETRAYFFIKKFPHDIWECPYMQFAFRHNIRKMLNDYEKDNSGTKANIVKSYDSFIKKFKKTKYNIVFCEKCKEPTSSNICRACIIKEEFYERTRNKGKTKN